MGLRSPPPLAELLKAAGLGAVVRAVQRRAYPSKRCRRLLAEAGLTHRFLIVQETYVPTCAEMQFDEPLWLTLLSFVEAQGLVGVISQQHGRNDPEIDLERWNARYGALDDDDREPAPFVFARDAEGRLVLALVTEDWSSVGGPWPYHDGYAYALFAARDLEAEVTAWLAAAPHAARWRVLGPHTGQEWRAQIKAR